MSVTRSPRQTIADRFWSKVDKSGECWIWTAGTDRHGYGRFSRGRGKTLQAHRVAYELLVGPIPAGKMLDHRVECPKNCVNPEHLRPATNRENSQNRAGANRNSRSGVRGVYWHARNGRWQVQVGHAHVGMFDSIEEAAEAARLKRLEVFSHSDADRAGAK